MESAGSALFKKDLCIPLCLCGDDRIAFSCQTNPALW